MLFLILSILVFNLVAIIIPKRLSHQEMYSTCLFATVLQLSVDIVLDLQFELYGYFKVGLDYKSWLVVFGLYPPVSIIFLNFYPFKRSYISQFMYLNYWNLFSVLYEWTSLKSEYFYHSGWKLWYSALCYPVLFAILALNLHLFQKMSK